MPKATMNYGLKKPLYSENADIAVINEGLDMLDEALTPSVSSASSPTSSSAKGKLEVVLGWLANRIKAITGKSSWQAAPAVTLEECNEHIQNGTHRNATTSISGFMSSSDKSKLDNATSSYTASRLMLRDSYGLCEGAVPVLFLRYCKQDLCRQQFCQEERGDNHDRQADRAVQHIIYHKAGTKHCILDKRNNTPGYKLRRCCNQNILR